MVQGGTVRLAAGVVMLALAACAPPEEAASSAGEVSVETLETVAERSGYRETSRYADVMSFLGKVADASPRVGLTTFGYTLEGRALPLAVVGAEATPEAVRSSGKTRVYIQANIHGGEVEGKEASQMLLRALALGDHAEWDESMVLLFAPIYNADGNERVSLANRTEQLGPVGGVGQRTNAQGYDLNRDHMKLESPEARSVVGLFNDYDPHVVIDLHTTNGTHHGYQLTYSPPLHPATPGPIVDLLRGQLLPDVTAAVKARDGFDFYYYGNIPDEGEPGWYTFDHRPRFGNNYAGLRNRLAILSEAYSYIPFEERVTATYRFVEEILDWLHAHPGAAQEAIRQAEQAPIVGEELTTRARFARSPQPVEILLADVVAERHPFTGRPMLRRAGDSTSRSMYEYGTFEATDVERVPDLYYIPAELGGVLDRLAAHGIRTTVLDAAAAVQVEEFVVSRSTLAEDEFQGHRERTLEGAYRSVARTLPAGTVVVSVDQPLGRLAFMLLEPRSDDGLANWNVLDEALEGADVYPIVRRAHQP